jgi:NAD(P)-dependent dehydrogenase (short-subunit alcohol dehydrogenase family)
LERFLQDLPTPIELAPVRVNLIAAGFVDTPLSASLLGDRLEARRDELRATLPIGRVVGPADVKPRSRRIRRPLRPRLAQ